MLMDYEPLEIIGDKVTDIEALKDFMNKDTMIEVLKKHTYMDENHELHVPEYDEREFSTLFMSGSQQKRIFPFGLRVLDYETEFTPLGRAIITVSAFVLFRKPGDIRHPDKKGVCSYKIHLVYIEKTKKWSYVDFENESHQNTLSYREREQQEIELNESFRNKYHTYFKEFSRIVNLTMNAGKTEEVKNYLLAFQNYLDHAREGMDAYRFFNVITPIQHEYIVKYLDKLKSDCERVEGYFANIHGDDEFTMYWDEKELFVEAAAVAKTVRNFFMPRTEKKPDFKSRFGYCPTFEFLNEIPKEAVPNAAEIERGMAFGSPSVHWSDEKEKAFIQDFVNHWFSPKKDNKQEPEPEVQKDESDEVILTNDLAVKYGITYKKRAELSRMTKDEAKRAFINISKAKGYPYTEYMKDAKAFTDFLKGY